MWPPTNMVRDPTFGRVSKSDVELVPEHEAGKQIVFVPRDGLSPFSGGKGWCSAVRPGDRSLVLLSLIFYVADTLTRNNRSGAVAAC